MIRKPISAGIVGFSLKIKRREIRLPAEQPQLKMR